MTVITGFLLGIGYLIVFIGGAYFQAWSMKRGIELFNKIEIDEEAEEQS